MKSIIGAFVLTLFVVCLAFLDWFQQAQRELQRRVIQVSQR